MAIAHALAMVPELDVAEAEPDADADALRRLALWSHQYTPLASPCPPDGLWLDIGGSAHLFGGEAALLSRLLDRMARDGVQANAAVADTPGAAHALARHGDERVVVVAPGDQMAAVARLPVACLRLAPETDATLRRLGFEQVEHLARIPRALIARRFGQLVGLRLDQVQGAQHEPLAPLAPEHLLQRREAFLDPLLTAEALTIAVIRLVAPLCREMERDSLGARRLDLVFERVDNQVIALRAGTSRPSRDPVHLVRLLTERLDTVEPGLGIEAMHLIVPVADPLRWEQQESGSNRQSVARLVDRLSNRLGDDRVYRATPAEHPAPECVVAKAAAATAADPTPDVTCHEPTPPQPNSQPGSQVGRTVLTLVASTAEPAAAGAAPARSAYPELKLVPPPEPDPGIDSAGETPIVLPWKARHDPSKLSPGPQPIGLRSPPSVRRTWPRHLVAPARLLSPPRPVLALSSLPDEAPVAFTWRRRHRVLRSEGPERVQETWWHGDRETDALRDYFRVEVEGGQRFWLFRLGDGLDPRTGNLSWFLHGLF